MADVFVSYSSEDRQRVAVLVELLEREGWSVWWDRELVPGARFETVIEQALAEARCVVVVWSESSVRSHWVQAEAGEGLSRELLIPVMFDPVRLPLSFRHRQAAKLIGWPRRRDRQELERFLRGVRNCLEGGQEQAGPDLSRAAPRRRWARPVVGGALAAVALAAGVWWVSAGGLSPAEPARDVALLAVDVPPGSELAQPAEQLLLDVGDRLDRLQGVQMVEPSALLPTTELGAFELRSVADGGRLTMMLDRLNGGRAWQHVYDLEALSLSEVAGLATAELAGLLAPEESPQPQLVPEQAYRRYLAGRGQLSRGEGEAAGAAIVEFEAALELLPRYPEAHAGLCRAYLLKYGGSNETADFAHAERHCFRALTMGSEYTEIHLALGSLYNVAGRFDEAVDHLEEARGADRANGAVLRELAVAYAGMGLSDRAIEQYLTAIAADPTQWRSYNGLGSLYFSLGRMEEAAQYFELAADYVPDNVSTLNNLGAAYYLSGAFDRAVEIWRRSAELEPDVTTLSNLGSAWFFGGDFARARSVYLSAIDHAPQDYRLWGNVADATAFIDAPVAATYYEKAAALAEKHLEVNPDEHSVLSHLATYYAALGQPDRARDYLERAAASSVQDIYLIYDRAVVQVRLGAADEARTSLHELVAQGYSPQLIAADANFRSLNLTDEEVFQP